MTYIELRYSNDSHNWSNWKPRESGETGSFELPLVWRRLGMSREQRVWEWRDTSDTAAALIGASVQVG